jgi:hypothetical protein
MAAIKGQQAGKWTPVMRAQAALRARQTAERQRLAKQIADAAAVGAVFSVPTAPAPVVPPVSPVATPQPPVPVEPVAVAPPQPVPGAPGGSGLTPDEALLPDGALRQLIRLRLQQALRRNDMRAVVPFAKMLLDLPGEDRPADSPLLAYCRGLNKEGILREAQRALGRNILELLDDALPTEAAS